MSDGSLQQELAGVVAIARALSQERDLSRLLTLVLEKSRHVTGADAGSVYLVETGEDGLRRLRFATTQNETVHFEASTFSIPITSESIAGAAAVTKKPINIPDVHALEPGAPFQYDPSFDEKVGYHTASMIAVPMISAEGEVLGVIQLINKKRDATARLIDEEIFRREVVPFDARSESLLFTLASQAGIAVENARLYEEIQAIFEGFVRASVQAIEQRDPSTSGHSLRVSTLSCRLAEVVDRVADGPFADVAFSRKAMKELEYAALLHDFGKIGVREQVLVKAKKLYPSQLDAIRSRFAYIERGLEVEFLKARVALLEGRAPKAALEAIETSFDTRRGALAGVMALVLHANEPSVLSEGNFSALSAVAAQTYVAPDGAVLPLLTEAEIQSLQVTRGSLTSAEVGEIQSHVVHTIDFLSRIPWGKFMGQVPVIAGAHHEKLDGTGYPRGLRAEQIPLPSKIMTITDIFDALTAHDRPYKRAVPLDRALRILALEVEHGHIDEDLVDLFVGARVFEVASPPV